MEIDSNPHLDADLKDRDFEDQMGTANSGFVRKVFGLIASQVLLTIVICGSVLASNSATQFLLENPVILAPACAIFLVTALMPVCCKSLGRRVPINYVILYTFVRATQTTFAAIILAYPCILVDDNTIVIAAAVLTLLVTVTLAAVALKVRTIQSSVDLRVGYSILMMMFVVSLGWLFLTLLLPTGSWASTAAAAFGAIIFGIYILIDVSMIKDGVKYGITNDDYVFGAILIYLDMMNLFLRLLEILSKFKQH